MEFYISFSLLVLFNLMLGSFCNVLVYRIPKGEQFVSGRSYCPHCKHQLAWYDNIPLFSYLVLLRGRCRYCKEPISKQYPFIEFTTCFLGSLISFDFLKKIDLYSKPYLIILPFAYSIVVLMLVTLSMIDFKTYEIPMGCNITIFICGVAITILEGNYLEHIIGTFSISVFLALVFFITSGRGLGFGDVKLMFACGLVFGWKAIIIGFLVGCILALIIHPIRMVVSKESNMLAFGHFLSMGVYIGYFIGKPLIDCYIGFLDTLV